MTQFLHILDETELPVGTNKAVDVLGQSILLCRTSDGVFAIANVCTHQLMPLEGGRIRGNHIFCPAHGARFDLATGCPSGSLTSRPVQCFEVRISNGKIEVAANGSGPS